MGENDLNGFCPQIAAEYLMTYIGQNGTWTPAHIDHCGAIGHNIMVSADNGSSIWFSISVNNMDSFEELCRSIGREPQFENYFLSVDELALADFPVYVTEQKTGDIILIPSLSYHQVVNLGAATIKVAWNRRTTSYIKLAVDTVLPRYTAINNPEVFRIKSVIKYTLEAWTILLVENTKNTAVSKEAFCCSFKELVLLFKRVVEEDWIDIDNLKNEKWANMDSQPLAFHAPDRSNNTASVTCDFCKTDIFKPTTFALDALP
ncbi:hypothetical protein BGZ65_004320 [Modicella reniformis]|uniref:JmjC domain-containing protein n=1 Tax=Modicella reniformis TaxID=1440133 RepID=A0A9P6M8Y7_9FUNG|nr:hypothetical protein BGZ65_004320 [Modicella reniformis]